MVQLELLVEKLALDVDEDKLYSDVVMLDTIPADLTPDRLFFS